jgi:hypothetical protein
MNGKTPLTQAQRHHLGDSVTNVSSPPPVCFLSNAFCEIMIFYSLVSLALGGKMKSNLVC